MKVITIGRSSDNTVCINDPFVGRHHCQIIQCDDGTYAIVDMRSTNGTYVNGGRIYGEARLQPNDTVIIGRTSLPWMSYFDPDVSSSNFSQSSIALPITLSITGGMLLLTIVVILCFGLFRAGSDKAFAFKGECPDAVVVDMTNEDGVPYTIEAIEGQVCVWFEEGTPYKTAKKSIKASGGRIVAQIPEDGYYLVTVPSDKVQVFLKRITKENYVDWAYPNLVYYPCIAKTFVLDNFYPRIGEKDTTPHGDMVQFALQDYDKKAVLKSYNIGRKGGKSMNVVTDDWQIPMSSNNTAFAVFDILSSSGDEPLIINMSFGVSLPKHYKNRERVNYYWTEATDREKESYRNWYLQGMKNVIHNVRSLKGKDFVIVKSAGNEGVKVFGDSIISYLRQNLTPEEKKIMDEHFLLVTAGETEERHKDYSNEMEEGRYDPWVTKVDVSDFKYNGEKRRGTSFAAPRAAGILSSVANEMNLTGAEVLKYARETTLNSKDHHTLTYESLMNTVKSHQSTSSQRDTPQQPTPKGTNPSAPSSQDVLASLAGTKWEMPQLAKQPRKHLHRVEFVNDHQVKIISLEDNGINNPYNTDAPYDCYYKSETNRIMVKRWINPSLWYDFEEFEYKDGFLYGWSYGEKFAYKKLESAKSELPKKQTSGMGPYDYSATISYSESLFKNKSTGHINLPNGEVIKYQYVYENDIWPEYYMTFTMENGGNITSKYSIALVETMEATQGYVGSDKDGYIDMRISYMGFDPKSSSKMIVLIRKK